MSHKESVVGIVTHSERRASNIKATLAESRPFNSAMANADAAAHSPLNPSAQNRSAHLYRGLVGNSRTVTRLRSQIRKIAASKSTVLISGETGTGKEIVARNIHYHSQQSFGPFVPVNCSAISPELLESELFGHQKSAFAGSLSDRLGRLEMAAGGTLFLDEIGDMTPELQAKLVRVLEERIFRRVGCNKSIAMTARVVAATHRNLEQGIEDGLLRNFYSRLDVVPIEVPPLRHRKEDIPELVMELSRRLQREQGVTIGLSSSALKKLRGHDWPGNVRELANLVEGLAVVCPHRLADASDLPDRYQKHGNVEQDSEVTQHNAPGDSDRFTSHEWTEKGVDLRGILRSTEAQLIEHALDQSGGTMTGAAQLLHVRRTTLVEKVKRLGLVDRASATRSLT